MGDRIAGADAAKKRLREDERLRKRIFAYAYKLTGNLPDAKELAQEGMAKAIDPEDSPWDPDKHPKLLDHIGSLMNTIVANKRRGHRRHPATPYDPKDDLRPDPQPTALDRLVGAEDLNRYRHWMQLLLVRLAGDGIALGKIELMYDEIDDAAEQAARLKCAVDDIYNANRRIAYQVEIVKRAAPDGALPPSPPLRSGAEARWWTGGRSMSPPRKRTDAEVWKALEKIGSESELERIDALSDEALDRELRAAGIDPAAAAKVGPELRTEAPKASRSPRALRAATWVAVAAVAALVLAALVTRQEVVAQHRPDKVGGLEPVTPQGVADKIRDEALDACEHGRWGACEEKLNAARALDPAGESEPRVLAARRSVHDAQPADGGH